MHAKMYPGMNDHAVEFFSNNGQFKFIQNGHVKDFNEIPFPISQILKEEILTDANVESALLEMHPHSEIRRIEQFAKCRFGGLDLQADIIDNVLQDGEYWACPLHGNCKHEGTLCKLPVFNGERLTKTEVQLMQLSATEKTNEVIAEEMNMANGTFHQQKKYLHRKLGVQTKQGMTLIASFLSIV